ncbi:MAG: c-type cytochrome [Natronospirillum sp.]
MRNHTFKLITLAAALTLGALASASDFDDLQNNLFTPTCSGCHGATGAAGLSLTAANAYANLVNVASRTNGGIMRVAPGDPDNSMLIKKVEGQAGVGSRMPLGRGPLPDETIQQLRDWIAAGAPQ